MKNRDKRWVPLMGILLIAAAAIALMAQMHSTKAAVSVNVKIWEGESGRYLFLPSWANLRAQKELYAQEQDLTIMQSENLPSVEIHTLSGSLDALRADKDAVESAAIRIMLPDGSCHYEGRISEFPLVLNSEILPS